MKHISSLLGFLLIAIIADAQTMRLIPFETNLQGGGCLPTSLKNKPELKCYVLEYTPVNTGTLTGYTTGFFVSCTSRGEPVDFNTSCVMTDNTRIVDGCQAHGITIMNSSGNSGTSAKNRVVAGVPVILHQVCFNIPLGESISVKEDELTDLTASILKADGMTVTEYPSFSMTEIKNYIAYEVRPVGFLDFKSIPVGEFIAQLDWTTKGESTPRGFDVERSADGKNFSKIGRVDANALGQYINGYRFMDQAAQSGVNYYRLKLEDQDGAFEYSPVRHVTFTGKAFAVSISPNPATEYIQVDIRTDAAESQVKLLDASGRAVMEERVERVLTSKKLDIGHLGAGTYTIVVNSGKEKYVEQIVIIE